MKKLLKALWGLLRNNLVIKIMAVLFAVILWSYVLAEENPVRERAIPDVPVRYEHMEDLKANGFAIVGGLSEALKSVDVRVELKQSELNNARAENVQAYIDLSAINSVGTRKLEVSAQFDYGEVIAKSPGFVTLEIDKYATKTVPVNVNVVGSIPNGYYAAAPEITPDLIEISGARSDVDKVVSAVCTVDLTGRTDGYNKSVDVDLLDSAGAVLDDTVFSENVPSVAVKLTVLSMKTVPVDVEGSIVGADNLAPGYEITDMACIPDTVNIAGAPEVLKNVLSIQLVPCSVNGANGDISVLLEYQPPEGVTVLSEDKAQVYITIREQTDTKEYGNIEIQQKNLSSGLEAQLDENTVDVTVIAGINRLSALDRRDIVPYVDLEGLVPGKYSLEVMFELPEGFVAENFSPNISTVTVTIW